MNRAIFFDKDGVINVDKGTSGNFEPLELIPGIAGLITLFRKSGFKIFIATNQPVVARGLMSESELEAYMNSFRSVILAADGGAVIDKIYYCPHHPNANVERYKCACECRKPKPGMLLKAGNEFGLDMAASYMIGDRMSDIIAGDLAGCRTIQFLSGKHLESSIETDLKIEKDIKPAHLISDINELRSIIK